MADLLGTPQEQSAESSAPPPPRASPPSPQTRVPDARPATPPPARQPKADWKSLANVLGLGGKTAPADPDANEQPLSTPGTELEPQAASRSEPVQLAAVHWDSPPVGDEAVDPLEMSTEPFVDEVVDAVELDVDFEAESPTDAATEERRRRRRRRRRRGRRPDEPATQGEHPPAESTERADEPALEEFVGELDRPPAGSSETGGGEGREPDEIRKRRRRRRRRGSGIHDAKSSTLDVAPPSPTAVEDAADEDDTLAEVLSEDDTGEDLKGDEHALSHKKIPSWQEAIEVVVSNNLAQRAKHPGGGSRGRGRRDRER